MTERFKCPSWGSNPMVLAFWVSTLTTRPQRQLLSHRLLSILVNAGPIDESSGHGLALGDACMFFV